MRTSSQQEACFQQFLAFIRQKAAMTNEEFAVIQAHYEYRFVPKGTVLWRQGSTCHEMAFIGTGLARSFFLDENGKEITRRLAVENNMCSALGAYIFQRPSEESVVTEEDSHMLFCSREDDMRMQTEIDSYQLFRIRQTEQELVGTMRFLDGFLANDAAHRYRRMAKYSSEVFDRVALKHIASLIGVTPTQLSRIRAKWRAGASE